MSGVLHAELMNTGGPGSYGFPNITPVTISASIVYLTLPPKNVAASIQINNGVNSYIPGSYAGTVGYYAVAGVTVEKNQLVITDWLPWGGNPSNYEVQAQYVSSTTGTNTLDPTFQSLGTWYNLGNTYTSNAVIYNLLVTGPSTARDVYEDITFNVNIRYVGTTTNLISVPVTLTGETEYAPPV